MHGLLWWWPKRNNISLKSESDWTESTVSPVCGDVKLQANWKEYPPINPTADLLYKLNREIYIIKFSQPETITQK